MKELVLWTVAALAAAVLAAGCKPADDEYAPAYVPKVYAFEGTVQPKFAGTWKTPDGSSTMDLAKDGALKIATVTHSVSGIGHGHMVGEWRVDGADLVFRYAVGSQPARVFKYSATVTGGELMLAQVEGHGKTVYKRQ